MNKEIYQKNVFKRHIYLKGRVIRRGGHTTHRELLLVHSLNGYKSWGWVMFKPVARNFWVSHMEAEALVSPLLFVGH